MAQVLRHELSHLLLAEATGHAALPRWFAEGIAVQQSDEHTFERFQELASASWTGRVLPLARLDEGFVEGPDAVNVAYAQSADFMGWLVRREGAARFAVMLEHVRDGSSLDDALRETYGVGLTPLEQQWKLDLSDRVAFAPIWAGTGLVSVLGALFVVVAMVRRWRRNKAIRAKWDREERAARSRWLFAARPSLRLIKGGDDDRPLLH